MDAVYAMLDQGKIEGYVTDFPDASKLLIKDHLLTSFRCKYRRSRRKLCSDGRRPVKRLPRIWLCSKFGEFPSLDEHPHSGVKSRVVVINEDVPNMIAEITKVIGGAGINISSFSNKSNGKIGYNLIDAESVIADSVVDLLSKLPK